MARAKNTAVETTTSEPIVVNGFTLEAGIDIPEVPRVGNPRETVYPFEHMQVGQSFFVKADEPAETVQGDERTKAIKDEQNTLRNRIGGAARRFEQKHEGYKFVTRPFTGTDGVAGIRCWRVEYVAPAAVPPATIPAAVPPATIPAAAPAEGVAAE